MKLTERDIERYWSKVDRSGGPDACWPWLAGKRNGLYGQFHVGSEQFTSTHIALVLDGRPLRSGFGALHTCDNPPCQNPRHLYEGTQAQNNKDTMDRGKWGVRDTHWNNKIKDVQRKEIVLLVQSGKSHQKVADIYGVSRQTVSRIVSDSWYESHTA